MTSKHVLMYQCDHCKRMRRNKQKAIEHERGCIRNPQRVCGMCEREGRTQVAFADLVQHLEDNGFDQGFRERAGCPMCMLAAVYESNRIGGYGRHSEEAMWFDYKAELARHDAAMAERILE